MAEAKTEVVRQTRETQIRAGLSLAPGECTTRTGIGFLDHMLATLGRHAGWSLAVEALGDLHVDAHHTVEDVGLCVGEALDRLLGERAGIARFGFAWAPMDEALARAVVDVSGRPFCRVGVPEPLATAWVTPQFGMTLVGEFWKAVASRARLTVHLDLERASDPHHGAEAVFKAGALALRQALRPVAEGVLSTKGTLSA
ncbi:MAG TPA: imidazoleglycerol-phosphate dehydratase [Thermoanaerobaculaceae bacterium]|nr:imidazoleglycerol-phosphate dehydratase [Thermoanaerobaculaceae bacterium]HRS17085.1 imidazoleglycerol-phosphate dehydratase [Thermoanaerobaculaceae bacterium]